MCHFNPAYEHFLQQCLGTDVGRLVLYTDGTTPGNNIVPWRERELTSFTWTLAEFPGWFRAAEFGGWLPFGALQTSVQKELGGDLSGVVKYMLRMFFSRGGFNFNDGIAF